MPPVVVPPRDNNNAGPPQPNPVLTAYESYCRDTPLVTRYVLNVTVLSFLAGFLFSPAYLLANIPIFTIFKFQLYRIITSPLICTDILSLFFTFMGFMNHGVKLEVSSFQCCLLCIRKKLVQIPTIACSFLNLYHSSHEHSNRWGQHSLQYYSLH